MDWITAAAAGVQAVTAFLIFLLTRQLVKATQQYALDTRRLADEMVADRRHQRAELSRQAALALMRAALRAEASIEFAPPSRKGGRLIPAEPSLEQLGSIFEWWQTDYLEQRELVLDADVRERLYRVYFLLLVAFQSIETDRRKKHSILYRVRQAFTDLRDDLGHYLRDEPLPAMRYPHPERVDEYLEATPRADASDYSEPR